MLFRRLIIGALAIGALTGLLLSLLLQFTTTPIILAAEQFENGESSVVDSSVLDSSVLEKKILDDRSVSEVHAPAVAMGHGDEHSHDHSAVHQHEHPASTSSVNNHHSPVAATPESHSSDHHDHHGGWAPADGSERFLFTLLSNVLAAIGFAAVMLACMSQIQLWGWVALAWQRGWLWGVAGFFAFFFYPSLGMPPEIPGMQAAALEARQQWWLLSVLCAIAGVGLLAFAAGLRRWIGLLVLLIPFVAGRPEYQGAEFLQSDPLVVAQLTDLHQHFIIASSVSNLLFWLVLGLLCAWRVQVWNRSAGVADAAG